MTTIARSAASSSSPRVSTGLKASAAALLAAAAVVAVIGVFSARPDHPKTATRALHSQALGFSLTYGKGWTTVPPSVLTNVPSKPAAMLRRNDRKGLVTVRQTGSARMAQPRRLAIGMRRDLARRFPDFRAVSARVVPIRAGHAFLFTFVRTRSRVVQTIALAEVGTRTFELQGVVPGDAPQAARETAAILSSFGP
jgi:hypothetical protein